jgi:hypothetical protein
MLPPQKTNKTKKHLGSCNGLFSTTVCMYLTLYVHNNITVCVVHIIIHNTVGYAIFYYVI